MARKGAMGPFMPRSVRKTRGIKSRRAVGAKSSSVAKCFQKHGSIRPYSTGTKPWNKGQKKMKNHITLMGVKFKRVKSREEHHRINLQKKKDGTYKEFPYGGINAGKKESKATAVQMPNYDSLLLEDAMDDRVGSNKRNNRGERSLSLGEPEYAAYVPSRRNFRV